MQITPDCDISHSEGRHLSFLTTVGQWGTAFQHTSEYRRFNLPKEGAKAMGLDDKAVYVCVCVCARL